MMEERDDLRKQDPASPRLSTMNEEITKATSDHKIRQWREFVESIDHRTDSTKLWMTMLLMFALGLSSSQSRLSLLEIAEFPGSFHWFAPQV